MRSGRCPPLGCSVTERSKLRAVDELTPEEETFVEWLAETALKKWQRERVQAQPETRYRAANERKA